MQYSLIIYYIRSGYFEERTDISKSLTKLGRTSGTLDLGGLW